MNEQEAASVLGVMAAAWPRQELSQQTVQLWTGMLERVDAEHAMAAAKAIIRSDNWFPSIARFLQTVETEAQYQRAKRADAVGLPTARHTPVEPPKALTDAARRLLREMGSDDHWHGGPGPCPKCGGVHPAERKGEPDVDGPAR